MRTILFFALLLLSAAAYSQNSFEGDCFAEISSFDRRYYCKYTVSVQGDTIEVVLTSGKLVVKQYDKWGNENILTIEEPEGLIYRGKIRRGRIRLLRREGKLYAVKIRDGEKSFYFFVAKSENN